MTQLISDFKGVAAYLDDILVSGKNAEDHLENLRQLLQNLQDHGLRCRLDKCEFAKPTVEYLGHTLSFQGISKGKKVEAVRKMPRPHNLSTLNPQLTEKNACIFYRWGPLDPNYVIFEKSLDYLQIYFSLVQMP